MPKSAAVLCEDKRSLQVLEATLEELGVEFIKCRTQREALELVMNGPCSTLIVDFDLPGSHEAVRVAAMLPPAQKPALLAVASRAWPGTGQAFQSGASRILYRPLEQDLVKSALKSERKSGRRKTNRRKSDRFELKTLVYLEVENRTLAAISIDIGEHGVAVQATEPIPMNSNLTFRCLLPGTDIALQGHADVMWASDQGRAGLFFSKLSPVARKHLKQWLSKRSSHDHKTAARDLLPPAEDNVSFAVGDEEFQSDTQ